MSFYFALQYNRIIYFKTFAWKTEEIRWRIPFKIFCVINRKLCSLKTNIFFSYNEHLLLISLHIIQLPHIITTWMYLPTWLSSTPLLYLFLTFSWISCVPGKAEGAVGLLPTKTVPYLLSTLSGGATGFDRACTESSTPLPNPLTSY